MSTINTDSKTRENMYKQIQQNYNNSDLTEVQYIKACKQYLYTKKNDDCFQKLSSQEKESYLIKNNVLGYRFFRDRGLVETWEKFQNLTLEEIYFIIAKKSNFTSNIDIDNIDFSKFLNDEENILIVNPEMILNQIPKIFSSVKMATIWTSDALISEILSFDYENRPGISIKTIDIYVDKFKEQEKYKNIICIPSFRMQQSFKRYGCYAYGPSAAAAELLIENALTEEGILTIIMPDKVNIISGQEEHFRQVYGKFLIKVVDLPDETSRNTNMKPYLYQFSKKATGSLFISHSPDDPGRKFELSDVTNIDSSWDFKKPFKQLDEDILKLLSNKNHKKLSDIATVLRGKPLPKTEFIKEISENENNEDFVYIDMRAIKEDCIDFSTAKKYKIDKDLSSEYLKDGDILIPNKGSNTLKIVLYKKEDKNHIASDNLIVIRPNKRIISSEYLFIYLRSLVGQKLIKGIQRKTTIPFIKHRDLETIIVIAPTLFEQKKHTKNYILKKEKYQNQLEQIKNDMLKLEQDLNDIICGKKQDFEK